MREGRNEVETGGRRDVREYKKARKKEPRETERKGEMEKKNGIGVTVAKKRRKERRK